MAPIPSSAHPERALTPRDPGSQPQVGVVGIVFIIAAVLLVCAFAFYYIENGKRLKERKKRRLKKEKEKQKKDGSKPPTQKGGTALNDIPEGGPGDEPKGVPREG